jgi:hypothetical protein
MPAGEATELGTMNSSMFMGSGGCSFSAVLSTDLRSCWAIPLGVEDGAAGRVSWACFSLEVPVSINCNHEFGGSGCRTLLVAVHGDADSSPSSSTSSSPCAPDWGVETWSGCTTSISGSLEDLFSASSPGRQCRRERHRHSTEGRRRPAVTTHSERGRPSWRDPDWNLGWG